MLEVRYGGMIFGFERGFATTLTCSWPDCRTHLDAIRRVTPIRRVRLTEYREASLAASRTPYTTLRWIHRQFPGVEFTLPETQLSLIP